MSGFKGRRYPGDFPRISLSQVDPNLHDAWFVRPEPSVGWEPPSRAPGRVRLTGLAGHRPSPGRAASAGKASRGSRVGVVGVKFDLRSELRKSGLVVSDLANPKIYPDRPDATHYFQR